MPTTTGLVLLAIFVTPGFIFRLVLGRNALSMPESDLRFLVRSLVDSLFIHAISVWWSLGIYRIWTSDQIGPRFDELVVWAVTVLLVAPFLLGYAWSKFLEWRYVQPLLSQLGLSWGDRLIFSWDWMAAKREGYWLVAEFKDGKKVGGRYEFNSRMSLTTWLDHTPRDLFIEELYEVNEDDTFGEPLAYNKGAWINGAELRMVRLYRDDQSGENGNHSEGKSPSRLKEVLRTWVSRL